MSELLEAFRRNFEKGHDAFNRHDFETAFASLPDDAVWEPVPDLVDRGRLEGKQAIIDAFREILDLWPDWRTELVEITEPLPGLIRMEFRGRGTTKRAGVAAENHFFQEWDFRARPMQIREYLA